MNIRITTFVFFCLSCFPTLVAAQNVWNSSAMACTPTSTTIAEAKYVTTAGVVKFKNNAVGTISFVCPVSNVLENGRYSLGAWIKTSDAAFETISVALRRRNFKNGHTETVLALEHNLISTFGQTEFRSTGTAIETVDFSDPFYIYWVQISIQRPSRAAEIVTVLSVELTAF